MKRRVLGKTGLEVAPLCFGTLSLSPLHGAFPLQKGADLIKTALDLGINMIDTAELYETYPYIKAAMCERQSQHNGAVSDVYVFSKSYAVTAADARGSVEKALRETGLDQLGGFLLHEQESEYTLKGHREALDELVRLRAKGLIRSLGISTHHIAAVRAAAALPEIDIIHPLYNYKGYGIADGTAAQMLSAIAQAFECGKGIYGMKILGGGHLCGEAEARLREGLAIPYFSAIAVGMKSDAEVRLNCTIAAGGEAAPELRQAVAATERHLLIEDWCQGCGNCVKRCVSKALRLNDQGKAEVDVRRCVLCGYCAADCPEFCIKVV
ncbi:MAG TPA: aldo/keto reductase [Firmicutes bacterium]|nr:aldo/keto reductase [Bacillota bacterium]HBE06486.1 aldo/keto reductase [Bacillota bacterium]HCM18415.1 aldo/keto reductase [Bacillota bacterium]HCX70833.1 aldo/keto reductase [Bacillota bacterium]